MSGLAGAPEGAFALWALASDGIRLRLGRLGLGQRGTVLLLTGRTEYLEKYGRAAAALEARGFGTVSLDWRGQGRSDRLLAEPSIGHVGDFADYQLDLATLVDFAAAENMPRPWYMLAHSLGGAIGLRALTGGLDVSAAVFSAPLWGITISPPLRPVAWTLGFLAATAGRDGWVTPGMSGNYVAEADPEDNTLTTDPEMFAWMQRHLREAPELALGGPSLPWVYRALHECRRLSAIDDPGRPTLTYLPGAETVVSPFAIRRLVGRWPEAHLIEMPGARHEVMMETKRRRTAFFDDAAGFFAAHG